MANTTYENTKARVPLAFKIILVILTVLLVLVIAVYGLILYYSSKLASMEEVEGATLEDVLSDVEGSEAAGSLAELLENADEETQKAMSEADEALKQQQEAEITVASGVTNYLLIGSDRRYSSINGNSDVMILVSVNNDTGRIHLTSLMRAMYVTIPASSGTFSGMLNWAYSIGGPQLTVDTIEQNFKVEIDHYACVDFTVFEEVVDAIGGVELTLTQSEANYINYMTGRYELSEGTNLLDGEQALRHARNRNQDNDFVRTSRQRDIVESVIKSMRGLSVSELTTLADVVLPYITTDLANQPTELLKLLASAPTMLSYEIDQLMLPIENMDGTKYVGITHIGGSEMYIVDWENNLKALENFING